MEDFKVTVLSRASTIDRDADKVWQIDIVTVMGSPAVANNYNYSIMGTSPEDCDSMDDYQTIVNNKRNLKSKVERIIIQGAGVDHGTVTQLPLSEFFAVTCVTKIK